MPSEPIRNGQSDAKIVVDLGEYVVTRKFRRDSVHSATCARRDADKASGTEAVPCNCVQTFGPTTSSLTVTNKDGAKYPTPQALLDKLLGKLTFDPLAFARAEAKDQNGILRRLVGVNTADIDEQRRTHMALRSDLKKQLAAQEALLVAAPVYPDAPADEITAETTIALLADAERARASANALDREASEKQQEWERLRDAADTQRLKVRALREQVANAEAEELRMAAGVGMLEDQAKALREEAEARKAQVPDMASLQAQIKAVESTNQKVRANAARTALQRKRDDLDAAVRGGQASVENLDALKAKMLDEAEFPVPGLGLSDNGVTYNGVPFEQAATSEQIRTSVAIGLALNPTLKVLLVRDGNALDSDSMKALAAQAADADAQVWCEYVTDEAGKVSVLIEDGHVV